jgi:hypothetical protein
VFWRIFGKKDPPVKSLVFFLSQPRDITELDLIAAANRAFGAHIRPRARSRMVGSPAIASEVDAEDEANPKEFVASSEGLPTMILKVQGYMLLVHSIPLPYTADPAAASKTIRDLRLRHVFAEHQAWLGVDLLNGPAGANPYILIGKLLAELSGPDCLAVYSTETTAMNVFSPLVVERLRGPDPLSTATAYDAVPVSEIDDEDAGMLAAVAEAHRRWPEFEQAFRRGAGELFSAKFPFREGTRWSSCGSTSQRSRVPLFPALLRTTRSV